jgi:transcriptional regulator with XRE-family HTH domain
MELSIGKNIQDRRKALGLTQEQVADALGVSIAAVSKWETVGAYPDITLLAPLSRLLGVTVDNLLGYESELSEERAMSLCEQCTHTFENGSFEQAVGKSTEFLREYPNSALLKLRLGNVFMMHISCARSEEEAQRLLEQAEKLMREAAKSEELSIREGALQGLCALLMQQERYEDALKALEQIHQPIMDPMTMKVSVYYAMGDLDKSKQTAQYLLANHLFACDIALGTLSKLARKRKNIPLALRIEKLSLQLSKMFDRDQLYGQNLNHHLMIAQCYAEDGKVQETLDSLRKFVACARMPLDFEASKSSPFADSIEFHMTPNSKSYLNRCAHRMVSENTSFDFLKSNPEFEAIVAELEQLPQE